MIQPTNYVNNNNLFPREILDQILVEAKLDGRALVRLERTCKAWHSVIKTSVGLWKQALALDNAGFDDRCNHLGSWKEKFKKQTIIKRNLASGNCTQHVIPHFAPGNRDYYHLAEKELIVALKRGGLRHYDRTTGVHTKDTTTLPPSAFPASERPDHPVSIVSRAHVTGSSIFALRDHRYLTTWFSGEQHYGVGFAIWSDETGECLFAKRTNVYIISDITQYIKIVDNFVIFRNENRFIEIWDINNKQLIYQIPNSTEVNLNNVDLANKTLIYFTKAEQRIAHLYNIETQSEISHFNLQGEFHDPDFTLNYVLTDKHVLVNAEEQLYVYSILDGKVVQTIVINRQSAKYIIILHKDHCEFVYYVAEANPTYILAKNIEGGKSLIYEGAPEFINDFTVTQNRIVAFGVHSICIWDRKSSRPIKSHLLTGSEWKSKKIKNNILYIKEYIKPWKYGSRDYPRYTFIDLATGNILGNLPIHTIHEGLGRTVNGSYRGIMNYEPLYDGCLVSDCLDPSGVLQTEPGIDHSTPDGIPNRFVIYDFTTLPPKEKGLFSRLFG